MPKLAQLPHLTAILLFAVQLCQAACTPEKHPHSPTGMPWRTSWKRRTGVPARLSSSEILSRAVGRGWKPRW
jgi:hypothetical protein